MSKTAKPVSKQLPLCGWCDEVPLELHGHRKKLLFFLNSLDMFCHERELVRADISILEVGCSNGRNISLPLAELGFLVTGVDIHLPSITWAQSHNTFSNARFICQDFAQFSSDERFDVVVLSDILEHVDDPMKIVKLTMDHLELGGMVLVCIPNGYGPYENEQRFLRFTRIDRALVVLMRGLKVLMGRQPMKQKEYNYDSGHVQFFRMRDLEMLANKSGLRIVNRANGSLFGGGITYALGILLPFIVNPSLRLADYLPPSWVTTWYFRLERITDRDELSEKEI